MSQAPLPSIDHPLVVVSNRGPNDFIWRGGQWLPMSASGGLVSLLAPLARRSDVRWFCCVSEPLEAAGSVAGLLTTAADQVGGAIPVVPISLPATMYDAYYGRISNEVLWMLQHQITGPGGYEPGDDVSRQGHWVDGYLAANQRVAAAISAACPSPRTFLIQDYHLYPLPALLRRTYPTVPILHFTHIPFPTPSLMRLLPRSWYESILHGLLGADVVGLQTANDAAAFIACCDELLGAGVNRAESQVQSADGRLVRVRVYPASVSPEELDEALRSEAVAAARERLRGETGELSVIRVDRVDPSKNQVRGFEAFGRLLERRPDLRSRVRFSAFLVPSRTDLRIYRSYTDQIYQKIEAINAEFEADCGGAPIRVFYTNDRAQALAAMELCDVLLVNSLQDGMNLVAKEWALVSSRPGVLVLSRATGVAPEAADSALLVSALDVDGTAEAIAEALDTADGERLERLNRFAGRVRQWTAQTWLAAQLIDLGVASGNELASPEQASYPGT